MDYYKHIQDAINYIEEHLNDEILLERVAQEACMSLKQLYRMFYSIVGHTIKDYIRKRQISCAANEIKHTDRKITDIAFDYGFATHQSFCKIFKKYTGMSPTEYRATNYYYSFEAFHILIAETYYNNLHVKIINLEPFNVFCGLYQSRFKKGIEKRAVQFLNYYQIFYLI